MGAHHEGESFGADFELPPDRSYSETCAGVASVMLNHRLALQTKDVRHADAVERTLYNIIATSPAADGKGFYYTNVLHQRFEGDLPSPTEPNARSQSAARPPFFAVSCCPTNLTRTFASLGAYLATYDDAGVQLHQYASASVRAMLGVGQVAVTVVTRYPQDGRVEVSVSQPAPGPWTLTLRVPAWAPGATVTAAGETRVVEPGYVDVPGPVVVGETVVLDLPVAPRFTWADPRVDAVRGQVAVERGPVVHALESIDLRADVATARVHTDVPPVDQDGDVRVAITTVELRDDDWPYAPEPLDADAGAGSEEPRLVRLVPYHSWAERGPSTMRVWIPEARR